MKGLLGNRGAASTATSLVHPRPPSTAMRSTTIGRPFMSASANADPGLVSPSTFVRIIIGIPLVGPYRRRIVHQGSALAALF